MHFQWLIEGNLVTTEWRSSLRATGDGGSRPWIRRMRWKLRGCILKQESAVASF